MPRLKPSPTPKPAKAIQLALPVKDSQALLVWDNQGNVSLVPVRNQWVPERDGPVVMALLNKLMREIDRRAEELHTTS